MNPVDYLQYGVAGVLLLGLAAAGRIMALVNNERLAIQKRYDDLQELLRVEARDDAVRTHQTITMLSSLIDYAKSLKDKTNA